MRRPSLAEGQEAPSPLEMETKGAVETLSLEVGLQPPSVPAGDHPGSTVATTVPGV